MFKLLVLLFIIKLYARSNVFKHLFMLTRNQKSKRVYDVKELKEYFYKRFNELKNSLDVNSNTLENLKSEIKSDFPKLEDKLDNKIKALE